MKKNDIVVVVVLVSLLLGLKFIDDHVFKKFFPPREQTAAARASAETGVVARAGTNPVLESAPAVEAEAPAQAPVAVAAEESDGTPEQTAELRNDRVKISLSSRGASVVDATLFEYRKTVDPSSGPVFLDFSASPALAHEGLPGLSEHNNFSIKVDADGRTARFERATAKGARLIRTLTLGDSYIVNVQDDLVNDSGAILKVPTCNIRVGPMRNDEGHIDQIGFVTLGVDTLSPGGEGVQHWGSKIEKQFSKETDEKGLPKLPVTIDRAPNEAPVNWIAAKNKYFAQILTPEDGADGFHIRARRTLDPRESVNPDYRPKMTALAEVAASMAFEEHELAPGETFTRKYRYYVGPKKYSELHASSQHHVDVMEFGMWGPIGKILLKTLNFIHDHLWPYNYGLAIMLLTLIIKVLFWPITHKSTQSMKKMAALQPLMQELRKKYENNPQKLQAETMALYREHKVNPISGCLPMLIQIPVFIALFVVLRSAIELRFASFLWINDLSEPERIFSFGFTLPFVGWDAFNLLPLLMAGTMILQMKLTPSGGDPQQQKIMMILMPIMMLVMLYNYASGLALYWTTQNVLMIVQQLLMRSHLPAPAPVKA